MERKRRKMRTRLLRTAGEGTRKIHFKGLAIPTLIPRSRSRRNKKSLLDLLHRPHHQPWPLISLPSLPPPKLRAGTSPPHLHGHEPHPLLHRPHPRSHHLIISLSIVHPHLLILSLLPTSLTPLLVLQPRLSDQLSRPTSHALSQEQKRLITRRPVSARPAGQKGRRRKPRTAGD